MMKGIIFDLDGTLIQLPVNYEIIQNTLKEFSIQFDLMVTNQLMFHFSLPTVCSPRF